MQILQIPRCAARRSKAEQNSASWRKTKQNSASCSSTWRIGARGIETERGYLEMREVRERGYLRVVAGPGREREREGEATGRRGFEAGGQCRSTQYAAQRAGSRTRIVSLCSCLLLLFSPFTSLLSLTHRVSTYAARLQYASTNISRGSAVYTTFTRVVPCKVLSFSSSLERNRKTSTKKSRSFLASVTKCAENAPVAVGWRI